MGRIIEIPPVIQIHRLIFWLSSSKYMDIPLLENIHHSTIKVFLQSHECNFEIKGSVYKFPTPETCESINGFNYYRRNSSICGFIEVLDGDFFSIQKPSENKSKGNIKYYLGQYKNHVINFQNSCDIKYLFSVEISFPGKFSSISAYNSYFLEKLVENLDSVIL